MPTSAASIINNAAHAMLKIDETKQFIETCLTEYETLHTQIDTLRQEKESLTQTVGSLKTRLEELQGQLLADTRREVALEIPIVDFDAGQDSQDTFWETTTEETHHDTITQTFHDVLDAFHDVPDAMSVSTIYTSSTSSPHRKNRKNKWHKASPKKWRRMVKTHRLQSILLTTN
jgi:hypothetical protein